MNGSNVGGISLQSSGLGFKTLVLNKAFKRYVLDLLEKCFNVIKIFSDWLTHKCNGQSQVVYLKNDFQIIIHLVTHIVLQKININ